MIEKDDEFLTTKEAKRVSLPRVGGGLLRQMVRSKEAKTRTQRQTFHEAFKKKRSRDGKLPERQKRIRNTN